MSHVHEYTQVKQQRSFFSLVSEPHFSHNKNIHPLLQQKLSWSSAGLHYRDFLNGQLFLNILNERFIF